ncbi:hypothetical protein LIER_25837 [Lithospermum erythrorhizon]|uniref:Agenet domain-containing protein n=1 Tax=Lithospermum erythrorhizon TaxID=34254 RepID=A0AAV3R9Z3_LITER
MSNFQNSSQMDVQFPEFLTKGSLVEVSTAEEGFGCVWFEATVVSPCPSSKKKKTHKGKIHVEYKTLCCDDNLSVPLREHVNVNNVRPLPPFSDKNTRLFELYDVVDAFYLDGWWTGVITRVFEGLRFLVTFQNPPDELQFGVADLRLHMDWVNDSWVQPPKQLEM